MENQNFQKTIKEAIKNALKELGIEAGSVELEHPTLRQAQGKLGHGDYSSNIAMAIVSSGKGKGKREKSGTPLELAEAIKLKIACPPIASLLGDSRRENPLKILDRVEVAPPGFINFFLSKEALLQELYFALDTGEKYGSSKEGEGKRILVDHSHPNIAKRFGIGHLRSTIIGQAIIKLHKFLGWDVIADNFLGDWGTQFGMLIARIQNSKFKIQNCNSKFKNLTIDDFERMYVEFNQEAKDNPALMEEARMWFKKLEEGDSEAWEIWQHIKSISLVEFKRIWDLLGVEFDYIHAESFFEDKMAPVLKDAKEKGIAKEDQGALIVRIPGLETPLLLLKSDRATTYETRDLAAIRFWAREFKPEKIVYEVGVDQEFHFKQVFAVAEMLGYAKKEQLVHVKHGLYRLETGKMRTRAGQTVKLELILDEAIKRAKRLAESKFGYEAMKPRSDKAMTQDSSIASSLNSHSVASDEVAVAVGIGAIKYFDLSHHPSTDIVFDWEKMFALEGNSAPYLQYTHARCRSVLQRAGIFNFQFQISNLEPEEEAILRLFYHFPEVIQESAYNFSPNLLCNFLFELSQRYNTFYAAHRILDVSRSSIANSQSAFRLALTEAVANTLKTGLGLLGIQAPERM
ncbi:MAG: arginine--tRNA ligase [Candidatus Blackburnbacteria bacterium]|nr:arginine--tRNA ligase [Candidatus Blackburnbacteria bacterium]